MTRQLSLAARAIDDRPYVRLLAHDRTLVQLSRRRQRCMATLWLVRSVEQKIPQSQPQRTIGLSIALSNVAFKRQRYRNYLAALNRDVLCPALSYYDRTTRAQKR